jgi:hypothetical protein
MVLIGLIKDKHIARSFTKSITAKAKKDNKNTITPDEALATIPKYPCYR